MNGLTALVCIFQLLVLVLWPTASLFWFNVTAHHQVCFQPQLSVTTSDNCGEHNEPITEKQSDKVGDELVKNVFIIQQLKSQLLFLKSCHKLKQSTEGIECWT